MCVCGGGRDRECVGEERGYRETERGWQIERQTETDRETVGRDKEKSI